MTKAPRENPQNVAEGDLLWTPSAEWIENTALSSFMSWLDEQRGLKFTDYDALWRWSIDDTSGFWLAIWDYFAIDADGTLESIFKQQDGMFGTTWFNGVRANYAEHVLRNERKVERDEIVLVHSSELREMQETSWSELGDQVRTLATALRALGLRPGDRVVCYMPNIVETAIAMLATTAIGAVWSLAAPEFGSQTVIDRFAQIEPKLIFATDGYSFNGKIFDRRPELAHIIDHLPTLEHIVWLPYAGLGAPPPVPFACSNFSDLMNTPAPGRDEFQYERVAADHPLWILFSSGTTGLPKAIVHGHVGMIAEQMKCAALHLNLMPGKRMYFYTTTGWVMWNTLFSALIVGASSIMYDGSPIHGGMDCLWRLASRGKATLFGASPTLVQMMKAAGVTPKDSFDVSSIDTILLGGSPSTPETFQWFYENVKRDLFVTSSSGGTELASGLVASVPIQPVYAGEIQARALGMAVDVWNDDGQSVVNEIGELVVTQAMPSAPLFFWNDPGNERYLDSYYSTFPGVWRHGDLIKLNERGGLYIYGRSDSTLNRFGVRIGTSEIYSILEDIDGIADSLVICCETPGGGFYMPLFVTLSTDAVLDEAMKVRICDALKTKASPRHVPDEIHVAPGIPYTLTGKKMEVPIRRLMMGTAPEKVASKDAMAVPAIFDWYVDFANKSEVRARWA